VELATDEDEAKCHRVVPGVKGPLEFYWVVFDEPQFDADGDGPYGSAEIQAEYLHLVGTAALQ
jgi:hypothetical protein